MTQDKNIVLIGAGLSGLTAAFRLQKAGYQVTLLEKASRSGGAIASGRDHGILWESGPNMGMDTTPKINELLTDLGILGERVDANPISNRRFIVKHHELIVMPMGGGSFVTTPLFSATTKLGLFREPFIHRSSPDIDESVAGFVRRRLGKEFLDYAIEPFVSGIYAGDPEILSVKAAFPKLFQLEQRYGSLIKGTILGARERKRNAEKSKQKACSFSFKNGLQTLTDALAKALPDIQLGVNVESLARDANNFWTIKGTKDGAPAEWTANAVVLSCPADAVSPLLKPLSEDAAAAAAAISYAPVAEVVSVWKREDIAHELDGFGFLVPKAENTKILGTLFSSTIFPFRSDSDHAVLTTYIGGMRHPELCAKSDDELRAMEQADLSALIRIKRPPLWSKISRHEKAIPQYTFGHLDRIARIDSVKTHNPGLFYCCNWRGGIALSDCVKNAFATAEEIGAFLG